MFFFGGGGWGIVTIRHFLFKNTQVYLNSAYTCGEQFEARRKAELYSKPNVGLNALNLHRTTEALIEQPARE